MSGPSRTQIDSVYFDPLVILPRTLREGPSQEADLPVASRLAVPPWASAVLTVSEAEPRDVHPCAVPLSKSVVTPDCPGSASAVIVMSSRKYSPVASELSA